MDLVDKGVVPRKWLILKPPQNIPKNLVHHWIRGYFDGDGCISSSTKKNGYEAYSASLASAKNFCFSVKQIIKKELSINPNLYTRKVNKITTELSFGGNRQVYKFMEWLYKDATIYIQRKYDKFIELKQSFK
ncbi:hypothetical protein LCGC14_0390210 [marine sediment metagenome]|uniref:Homing endonuclease LAGLIDADG domain-containing protein n=1 Tax=marine sediment metagenome TaxID=412755 RepID=A0A0F9T5P1_9ZZZZ